MSSEFADFIDLFHRIY